MRNVSYNGFWGLNELLRATTTTKTDVTPKGSGCVAWGFNPRLSRIKRCAPEGIRVKLKKNQLY